MIFFRQGPNAVEMVRKDDDGVDAQRVTFLYGFESVAKCVNRRFIGQNRFALMCDQGEKIAAAGEIIAPVVHGASLFVLEYQITTQYARKREDIRATHCRRYALRAALCVGRIRPKAVIRQARVLPPLTLVSDYAFRLIRPTCRSLAVGRVRRSRNPTLGLVPGSHRQ